MLLNRLSWTVADVDLRSVRPRGESRTPCRSPRSPRIGALAWLVTVVLAYASPVGANSQIIDSTGDGQGNPLTLPYDVAVNALGTIVYVTGNQSDTVFEIPVNGFPALFMDSAGDGGLNPLEGPNRIVVGNDGQVYVTGFDSNNAFRIDNNGVPTMIIDASGDGSNPLGGPHGIAVDAQNNVYVAGGETHNVFKIEPNGGTITEIIDSMGDGTNSLLQAIEVEVDSLGRVYVTGHASDNVFRIDPGPTPTITQILDASGDMVNSLDGPWGLALSPLTSELFVSGFWSNNVFRIQSGGAITQIVDVSGAGPARLMEGPRGVTVDFVGEVIVAASSSNNVLSVRLSDNRAIELIDDTGDGVNGLFSPWGVDANDSGFIYVTGVNSNNAFRVPSVNAVPLLHPGAIALLGGVLAGLGGLVLRKARDD
jgi:sugar lactone lactonase YvrE